MSIFYGFKVCRVCLTPSARVNVTTLLGDKAEIYRRATGVDILKDENKYDALVCDACWETMLKIVNFIDNIKDWIIGDDSSPVKSDCCDNFNSLICHCCSSSLNIAFLTKMNEPTAEKLKEISGVDVTAGGLHPTKLICLVCFEFIEKSIGIRHAIGQAELLYFKERRKDSESAKLKAKRAKTQKKRKDYETLVVSENAKPSPKAKRAKTQKKSKDSGTEEALVASENAKPPSKAKTKKNFVIKLKLMPMTNKLTNGRFQCNLCEKSYSTKQVLENHIKGIHNRINKYSCDLCDYTTYLKPSIDSHISRNHGTSLFKCAVKGCKKSFKTKIDRKLHQAVHTDARPFVCECGKTYKSYQALYMHRRIKHMNQ